MLKTSTVLLPSYITSLLKKHPEYIFSYGSVSVGNRCESSIYIFIANVMISIGIFQNKSLRYLNTGKLTSLPNKNDHITVKESKVDNHHIIRYIC